MQVGGEGQREGGRGRGVYMYIRVCLHNALYTVHSMIDVYIHVSKGLTCTCTCKNNNSY